MQIYWYGGQSPSIHDRFRWAKCLVVLPEETLDDHRNPDGSYRVQRDGQESFVASSEVQVVYIAHLNYWAIGDLGRLLGFDEQLHVALMNLYRSTKDITCCPVAEHEVSDLGHLTLKLPTWEKAASGPMQPSPHQAKEVRCYVRGMLKKIHEILTMNGRTLEPVPLRKT